MSIGSVYGAFVCLEVAPLVACSEGELLSAPSPPSTSAEEWWRYFAFFSILTAS